jgi:hypothetical protein
LRQVARIGGGFKHLQPNAVEDYATAGAQANAIKFGAQDILASTPRLPAIRAIPKLNKSENVERPNTPLR